MSGLNHTQWVETVPACLKPYIEQAVNAWNADADRFNQWANLGWDERDAKVRQTAAADAERQPTGPSDERRSE